MPTTRSWAGVAGLCALALAATTAPATTAAAADDQDTRSVELLTAPAARTTTETDGERSRPVRIDTAALDDVRAGDRLALTLFDGTTVTASIDGRDTSGGATTWTGGLVGDGGTFTAAEVDGVVHLSIASAEHGTFEVSRVRGGSYEVTEVAPLPTGDDAVVPKPGAGHSDHADHSGEGSARVPSTTGAPVAGADDPSVIDVAIVYPASLPAWFGPAEMQAQFALGIAQTNQGLAASGVGTQVRLVGTRQVAATQASTLLANYNSLQTPGDGVFDEAQALREETHADLVSLWLGGQYPAGSSCGLGSLGGTQPKTDAERGAFTVMYGDRCATGNLTFAHEIGHNLSADHDAGASSPPYGYKPYARGYVDLTARTTTIMAYNDQCTRAGFTCTRITHFSNPNISFNGRPTGTPADNNAQAVAEQAAAVAGYRQSQIYPGAVSIAGRARYRGTAVASSTPWAPEVALSYQWFLDGVPVPGATTSAVRFSRRDIGRTVSVQVVGAAPYYASVATMSAPVVVGKALFRTKRPKLRGVPRAGRLLSVSVKGWKPKPKQKSVKVRYQWLKNGKKIKGAKKATYRVRAKDRGKKISVRVTAKKKAYDKAVRSSKKVKIRR
jgi:hypothetical protein